MQLDKQTTTIMKGYGILFIALHNFLHIGSIADFVKENENTFDVQRTRDYLNVLRTFEWSDVGQFFSFLGWIGVPVFLFVSGFGLVKSYKAMNASFENRLYVFHSWKKLAMLLLPGALFFVFLSFFDGSWHGAVPKCMLQLTLLYNFFMPRLSIRPGCYWYFGLTFELYLLYIILKRMNVKQLLAVLGGLVLIQLITVYIWGPCSRPWSWVRHNFLGWGQVFVAGMICAKADTKGFLPSNKYLCCFFALISLVLLPLTLLNKWMWLVLVPFMALLFFVFLSGAIKETFLMKNIGLWLGEYSAFIFVVHPIARAIVLMILPHFKMGWITMTLLYILLFLLGAILLKPIYKWLMGIKVLKSV